MKIELSIKDDRELRNHIKDAIKGEILSIARGEIFNIIKTAIGEKPELANTTLNTLVRDEIQKMLKKTLKVNWNNESDFIKEEAKSAIFDAVKKIIPTK